MAGIFYATLGAWLTFWACALLFPRRAAFWATLVVWLGGPAIYYSSVSPTYSHATSLFAVSLFVYVWLRTRGASGYGRTLLLGALAGLVALVRWQDARRAAPACRGGGRRGVAAPGERRGRDHQARPAVRCGGSRVRPAACRVARPSTARRW